MFTQIAETVTTPQTMTLITQTTKGAAHNLEDFMKRQNKNKQKELITCTACKQPYYLTSLTDAIICPRCGADQR